MTMQSMQAAAHVRSQTWWLLARIIAERPQPAFIAALRARFGAPNRNAHEDASTPARQFAAALYDPESHLAERLCIEHTRLFRAIQKHYGPPPPYESLYRGAELMGPPALAVRAAYAKAGLSGVVPADGLPDGLDTELKFLALLAFNEGEAWAVGASQQAIGHIERQRAFLDTHLLCWLPAYAQRIESEAREPFYSAALAMMHDYAKQARAELDDLTAELQAA